MENGPGLKMYFVLNMVIFHCYVSLPEGNSNVTLFKYLDLDSLVGNSFFTQVGNFQPPGE